MSVTYSKSTTTYTAHYSVCGLPALPRTHVSALGKITKSYQNGHIVILIQTEILLVLVVQTTCTWLTTRPMFNRLHSSHTLRAETTAEVRYSRMRYSKAILMNREIGSELIKDIHLKGLKINRGRPIKMTSFRKRFEPETFGLQVGRITSVTNRSVLATAPWRTMFHFPVGKIGLHSQNLNFLYSSSLPRYINETRKPISGAGSCNMVSRCIYLYGHPALWNYTTHFLS